MRKIWEFLSEGLKVGLILFGLFYFFINISQLAGLNGLTQWWYLRSPGFLFSDDKIDSFLTGYEREKSLLQRGQSIDIGQFRIFTSEPIEVDFWKGMLEPALASFSRWLGGHPPWLPVLQLRNLDGAEGSYDGLRILADPGNPEVFRVIFHELTHLYLFWSLFPGLPYDCPRWFNEGLAEELSGMLVNDVEGRWAREMIPSARLSPFHALSPAFSWPGQFVELQARDSAHGFLKTFGMEGVNVISKGLRRARPFRSIMQLSLGTSPEIFEKRQFEEFSRNRVISNLPLERVKANLEWLTSRFNDEYIVEQVRGAMFQWPDQEIFTTQFKKIMTARIEKAVKSRSPLQAMGWLRAMKPFLSKDEWLAQTRLLRSTDAGVPEVPPASRPITREGGFFFWLGMLAFSAGILGSYRCLREWVVGGLKSLWFPEKAVYLAFRWVIVTVAAFGSAWFIRFLVVGMIPYGGLAAIPDYERILLAEGLICLVFIGFSRQFGGWREFKQKRNDLPPQSSTVQMGILALVSFLPMIFLGISGKLMKAGLGGTEFSLTALANIASFLSSGFLVWSLTRAWSESFAALRPLFPAVCYLFLRNGICFDPVGTPYLVLVGWQLGKLAIDGKRLKTIIFWDFACCGAHFLMVPAFFLHLDPVGGLFLKILTK